MKKAVKQIFYLLLIVAIVMTSMPSGAYAATAKKGNAPKSITLSQKQMNLYVGQKTKLKVKAVNPQNSSSAVTFKTSNKKVATVNAKGQVVAKKTGNAKITVTSKLSKKVKATCKVKVYKKTKSLSLVTPKDVSLYVGESTQAKTKINPAKGACPVTWTSSDTRVATVNAKGNITAIHAGSAKITATSGAKKVVVMLTVKEKAVPSPSVAPSNPSVAPSAPSAKPSASTDVTESITVSFQTNGGSAIQPITVKKGSILSDVMIPSKPEAIFIGWYEDQKLEKAFDESKQLSEDTVLYAAWQDIDKNETKAKVTDVTMLDQKEDFAFSVTSEQTLTDENLSQYIKLQEIDGSDNVPKLSVVKEDGVYTIKPAAGNAYVKGNDYQAILIQDSVKFHGLVVDGTTIDPTDVNTLTFSIHMDEVAVLEYQDNIYRICKSDVLQTLLDTENPECPTYKAVLVKKEAIDGTTHLDESGKKDGRILKEADVLKIADREATQDKPYAKDEVLFYKIESIGQVSQVDLDNDQVNETEAVMIMLCEAKIADVYKNLDVYQEEENIAEDFVENIDTDALAEELIESEGVRQITQLIAASISESETFQELVEEELGDDVELSLEYEEADEIEAEQGYLSDGNTYEKDHKVSIPGMLLNGLSLEVSKGVGHSKTFYDSTKDWDAFEIKMIYNATIKDKVAIQANFITTEYLQIGLISKGNVLGDYKSQMDVLSQTDIKLNVFVASVSEDKIKNPSSAFEEGQSYLDITGEIDAMLADGDTSGNDSIVKQMQTMLGGKGGDITLFDFQLLTFKNAFYFLEVDLNLNVVIKVNFAAGIGMEATFVAAKAVGVRGNADDETSGAYSYNIVGNGMYEFDFYACGYIGLKAGLKGELTVSFIGLAWLGEVGFSLEVGGYADLYGYVHYSIHNTDRSFETGPHTTCVGGVYFETGIYLNISVLARSKAFQAEAKASLYTHKWPLFSAGDEYILEHVDYLQTKDPNVIIHNDKDEIKISDVVALKGTYLNIKTGDLEERTVDGAQYSIYIKNTRYFTYDPERQVIKFNKDALGKYVGFDGVAASDKWMKTDLYIKYSGRSLMWNQYKSASLSTWPTFNLYWIDASYRPGNNSIDKLGELATVNYYYQVDDQEMVKLGSKTVEIGKTAGPVDKNYYLTLSNEISQKAVALSWNKDPEKTTIEGDTDFVLKCAKKQYFVAYKYYDETDPGQMGVDPSGVYRYQIMVYDCDEKAPIPDNIKNVKDFQYLTGYYNHLTARAITERREAAKDTFATKPLIDYVFSRAYANSTYGWESGSIVFKGQADTKADMEEALKKLTETEGCPYPIEFGFEAVEYPDMVYLELDGLLNGSEFNGTFTKQMSVYQSFSEYDLPSYQRGNATYKLVGWDKDGDGKKDCSSIISYHYTNCNKYTAVYEKRNYKITVKEYDGSENVYYVQAGEAFPEEVLNAPKVYGEEKDWVNWMYAFDSFVWGNQAKYSFWDYKHKQNEKVYADYTFQTVGKDSYLVQFKSKTSQGEEIVEQGGQVKAKADYAPTYYPEDEYVDMVLDYWVEEGHENDADSVKYQPDAMITPEKNMVLLAVYKKVPRTYTAKLTYQLFDYKNQLVASGNVVNESGEEVTFSGDFDATDAWLHEKAADHATFVTIEKDGITYTRDQLLLAGYGETEKEVTYLYYEDKECHITVKNYKNDSKATQLLTHKKGEAFVLPSESEQEMEGRTYELLGYDVTGDGQVDYQPLESIKDVVSDMEITQIWGINDVEIRFYMAGVTPQSGLTLLEDTDSSSPMQGYSYIQVVGSVGQKLSEAMIPRFSCEEEWLEYGGYCPVNATGDDRDKISALPDTFSENMAFYSVPKWKEYNVSFVYVDGDEKEHVIKTFKQVHGYQISEEDIPAESDIPQELLTNQYIAKSVWNEALGQKIGVSDCTFTAVGMYYVEDDTKQASVQFYVEDEDGQQTLIKELADVENDYVITESDIPTTADVQKALPQYDESKNSLDTGYWQKAKDKAVNASAQVFIAYLKETAPKHKVIYRILDGLAEGRVYTVSNVSAGKTVKLDRIPAGTQGSWSMATEGVTLQDGSFVMPDQDVTLTISRSANVTALTLTDGEQSYEILGNEDANQEGVYAFDSTNGVLTIFGNDLVLSGSSDQICIEAEDTVKKVTLKDLTMYRSGECEQTDNTLVLLKANAVDVVVDGNVSLVYEDVLNDFDGATCLKDMESNLELLPNSSEAYEIPSKAYNVTGTSNSSLSVMSCGSGISLTGAVQIQNLNLSVVATAEGLRQNDTYYYVPKNGMSVEEVIAKELDAIMDEVDVESYGSFLMKQTSYHYVPLGGNRESNTCALETSNQAEIKDSALDLRGHVVVRENLLLSGTTSGKICPDAELNVPVYVMATKYDGEKALNGTLVLALTGEPLFIHNGTQSGTFYESVIRLSKEDSLSLEKCSKSVPGAMAKDVNGEADGYFLTTFAAQPIKTVQFQ